MSAPQTAGGQARLVLITAPDRETALGLARGLVELRLAGCVNLVPGVTSVYRWEGAVQEDAELLLIVKTRSDSLLALEEYVRTEHPFSVPELVTLEPARVEPKYLAWLLAQVGPAGDA